MSSLLQTLPWLVAGAALYHFGRKYLHQDARLPAMPVRKDLELEIRTRRLYHLARACQRGALNKN